MFYIGSVLLSLSVVAFVMAAVLAIFWWQRPASPGLKEIAAAMAVCSAAAVLSGKAATSADYVFGYAGMTCFVVTILLVARSMRRLQGLRPLRAMEIGILATCAVADAFFLFGNQAITGAVVTNSLAFAVIAGVTAVNLGKERRLALKPGCRVLAYMFGTFAAASLLRAGYRLFVDIPKPVGGQFVSVDLFYVFLGIAVAISWSLGFLWTSYYVAEYRLRTANERLARFSSAVAHDLNTPLNAIIGYLDAVDHLPASASAETKAGFIAQALDAARRMSGFIHDLLEQSRQTRMERAGDVVDTAACVHNALRPLRARIDAAEAEVHLGDLHPISANAFQMTRVFQNLLENAYKYRSETRRLRIHISSEHVEGWVVLCVKDNGRGISESDQAIIFDHYQRIRDESAVPGYGIGLSECRSIVESFDGSIEVASVLGDGATFILRLPSAPPYLAGA